MDRKGDYMHRKSKGVTCLTLLSALLFYGCVSTQVRHVREDLDKQMNALIGASEPQLVALMGEPERAVDLRPPDAAAGVHGNYVSRNGTMIATDRVYVYLSEVDFSGSRLVGYYQPSQAQNMLIIVNAQAKPFNLTSAIAGQPQIAAPPVPVTEQTTERVYYYQIYLLRSGRVVGWERRPVH